MSKQGQSIQYERTQSRVQSSQYTAMQVFTLHFTFLHKLKNQKTRQF